MSGIEPVGGLIRSARRRRQQRRWTAETFPTSTGGLLRAPYPSGVTSPPTTGGSALFGSSPIGELIRVTVENEHHGPGEPLRFGQVLRRTGFDDTNLPGVEIELPHTAVYGIEGDFSYVGEQESDHSHAPFVGGGEVSIRLNGTGIPGLSPIRAGGVPDRNLGKTFTLAQEFVAQKGDRLSIALDHADAEPTIEGVIEVASKEPLRVFTSIDFSELDIDVASQSANRSQFDLNQHATYWDPDQVAFPDSLEVGDLMVIHAYLRPSASGPASTNFGFVSLTPRNGWTLESGPFTQTHDANGFDFDEVSFVMSKVITQDDIDWATVNPGNPDTSNARQEIASTQWTLPIQPGFVMTSSSAAVVCPFRGPTTVNITAHEFESGLPWNTTVPASTDGGELLTSVIWISSITTPDDQIAVNGWETWAFSNVQFQFPSYRVQRALSPQTPRTVNMTDGDGPSNDPVPHMIVIFAVS